MLPAKTEKTGERWWEMGKKWQDGRLVSIVDGSISHITTRQVAKLVDDAHADIAQ